MKNDSRTLSLGALPGSPHIDYLSLRTPSYRIKQRNRIYVNITFPSLQWVFQWQNLYKWIYFMISMPSIVLDALQTLFEIIILAAQ